MNSSKRSELSRTREQNKLKGKGKEGQRDEEDEQSVPIKPVETTTGKREKKGNDEQGKGDGPTPAIWLQVMRAREDAKYAAGVY